MTPEQVVQMQRGCGAPGGDRQNVLDATGTLYHHHIVRAPQVMAQGVGTSVCPVPVGAGQQVVDKIAAQVELDLSDGSLVGKLQRQNGAAVAQGEQVVLGHRVVRVVQREDTEDLGAGLDEREDSPSDSCRTVLCGQLVQQEFA